MNVTCSICLNKLNNSIELNCKHTFCRSCIKKWYEKSKSCPMCRDIITISMDNNYNLRRKNHQFCVNSLKKMINDYGNCKSIEHQTDHFNKMFKFISEYRYFLNINKKFKNVVLIKLNEFKQENHSFAFYWEVKLNLI